MLADIVQSHCPVGYRSPSSPCASDTCAPAFLRAQERTSLSSLSHISISLENVLHSKTNSTFQFSQHRKVQQQNFNLFIFLGGKSLYLSRTEILGKCFTESYMWAPDLSSVITLSPAGGQTLVKAGTTVEPGQTDGSSAASNIILR